MSTKLPKKEEKKKKTHALTHSKISDITEIHSRDLTPFTLSTLSLSVMRFTSTVIPIIV